MTRLFAFIALLFVSSAFAQFAVGPPGFPPGVFLDRGAIDGSAAASYTGPGDIVSGAYVFAGFRAYTAAIAAAATQKLANIRNTATSETCDIIVAANGGFGNVANCSGSSSGDSVATFCAESSGTCTVTEIYDQTGNNRNFTQSTTTLQPALNLSCVNSLPCWVGANGQGLGAGTGPNQPHTFIFVNERTARFTSQGDLIGSFSSTTIANSTSANTVELYNGTVTTAPMSDSALHSLITISNNASSAIVVDGSATTVSSGTGGFGPSYGIGCSFSTACSGSLFNSGYLMEVGGWSSAFNSTQYGNMCHNQHTYWGTATSC